MPKHKTKSLFSEKDSELLKNTISEDDINRLESVFESLPSEITVEIFSYLTPSEAALLGRASSKLAIYSQEYFRNLNKKLVKDGYFSSYEIKEDEFEKNPKEIFAMILKKMLERMSVNSKVNLFENTAYLILLIKYCSVDSVKQFVIESFNRKSANRAIEVEENKDKLTAFHAAIQKNSVEILKILFEYTNTDYTKIKDLIEFAIEKSSLEVIEFLWERSKDTQRTITTISKVSQLDWDGNDILEDRLNFQKNCLMLALEKGKNDVAKFFLNSIPNPNETFYDEEDENEDDDNITLDKILTTAFKSKCFDFIMLLSEKISRLVEDPYDVCAMLYGAIKHGATEITKKYLEIFSSGKFRANPLIKENYKQLVEGITDKALDAKAEESIIEKLLKLSQHLTRELHNQLFEYIVENHFSELIKQWLRYHLISGVCLCIAAKHRNQDLVNTLLGHANRFAQQQTYQGKHLIVYAVEANMPQLVAEALEIYRPPSSLSPDIDPLLIAIKNGYAEVIQILVKQLKVTDHHLITAIQKADLKIIHILLTQVKVIDDHIIAAIEEKNLNVFVELVEHLILKKQPINYDLLMYHAALAGDLEIVKFLCKKGANPDQLIEEEDESQESAPDLLCEIATNLEVVKFLLKKSKLLTDPVKRERLPGFSTEESREFVNVAFNEVLVVAAKANRDDIVKMILPHITNTVDEEGNSLLHKVAKGECPESMRMLLQNNTRLINSLNRKNYSPAATAAEYGNKLVFQCILDCGMNINSFPNGMNFLEIALFNDQIPFAEFLIEKGINIKCNFYSRISKQNYNAYGNCYEWANAIAHIDILNLLIERADALHFFLNDKQPNPHLELLYHVQIGNIPKFQSCLEENHLDINTATPNGLTFLGKACRIGRLEMVEYLLSKMGNLKNPDRVKDIIQATVQAARFGHWEIVLYLLENTKTITKNTDPKFTKEVNEIYGLATKEEDSDERITIISNFAFKCANAFVAVNKVRALLEESFLFNSYSSMDEAMVGSHSDSEPSDKRQSSDEDYGTEEEDMEQALRSKKQKNSDFEKKEETSHKRKHKNSGKEEEEDSKSKKQKNSVSKKGEKIAEEDAQEMPYDETVDQSPQSSFSM